MADTGEKTQNEAIEYENNENILRAEEVFRFSPLKKVGNEEDLEDARQYHQYMRKEQMDRAHQVSVLLLNYTNQQNDRNDYKTKIKPKLLWFLIGLIAFLSVVVAGCMAMAFLGESEIDEATIGVLVTACITYLGSLITVLLIIVKYIFPDHEEENFNDLVKSIISNDTERIKNENETINKR